MTRRTKTLLSLSAVVCYLFLTAGCGGDSRRQAIEGTVTLDGQPLETGQISFRPQPGSPGPTAGAPIAQGRFSIKPKGGTFAGGFRVEITASRPTGRKVPDRFTGSPVDEISQYLPAKYNTQSELTAQVKAEGPNRFEFTLDSQ
jgi:hypothetical protein